MAGALLKDLRDLAVAVIHPPDSDGALLVQHLARIGCRVEAHWPPPETLPQSPDILLTIIERDRHGQLMSLLRRCGHPKPAVIAVMDYENPATLQLVLETDALGVIGKPVRPFGLLTNLLLVRSLWVQRNKQDARIRKLEDRIAGQKKIAQAKSILMKFQSMDEEQAHECIRVQAMAKRLPMADIAGAIIHANDVLNFRPKSD